MKIFVDTDADIRLSRRLKRDITNRGRNIKDVLEQYNRHVKPAFDHYIAPSMTHADLIVPRGGENEVAIKLIVQHVQVNINIWYGSVLAWQNIRGKHQQLFCTLS